MNLLKVKFTVASLIILISAILTLASCYRGYHSIKVDGEKRYYRIYAPKDINSEEKVPLLLALHQFSDTAKGMEKLTRFNELAEREKFIVVYPQGKWRIWKTDPLPNKDTKFLDLLIEHLVKTYPIDPEKIYATGASAGGMMIQAYACYSKKLSGIAPVMGSMLNRYTDERNPSKRIPVLIIHGTADPIVPYNGGETNAGPGRTANFISAEENTKWWANKYKCDSSPEIIKMPDSNPQDEFYSELIRYPCEPPVAHIKIYGGGHTWAGRKNYYPRFIVGPTAPEPDISLIIWKFLSTGKVLEN